MRTRLSAHTPVSSNHSHAHEPASLSHPSVQRQEGDACSSKKMRIFIIEDDDLYRDSLVRLLENAPEKDMQVVGSSAYNERGLAEVIKEKRVDMVIVDIVLRPSLNPELVLQNDETSGLVAISVIRRTCGRSGKIVGLSQHPKYRARALEAGANVLFVKGKATELREAIRRLHQEPPEGVWIGSIMGLELFPGERPAVVVLGDSGQTPMLRLQPRFFGLLYYLTKEQLCRREGEGPWLAKKPGDRVYRMSYIEFWDRVRKTPTIGGSFHFNDGELTKWCSEINKLIGPYVYQDVPDLIVGPGGGPKSEGSYSLSSQIVKDRIRIVHDPLAHLP